MSRVRKIRIQGFKSIRDQELVLGPLNVFVGGNGAGKSNLVEVFHFIRQVYKQRLQTFTGASGGANALLHFGRKRTSWVFLELFIELAKGKTVGYSFKLLPTGEDRFVLQSESIIEKNGTPQGEDGQEGWSGHSEARISQSDLPLAKQIREVLTGFRIYHFHDTGPSAPVKQTCDVEDNRVLREDASNLGAFLYRLKMREPEYFQNIEDMVREVAPFFGGFRLEPSALNPDKIRLEWAEKGSDTYFNTSMLSDGTLRFICLATLLMQPDLPSLVLIDEPELGLHPAAIQVISALLQSAATRTQLIVATQSVTLINRLTPDQVWVVDRGEEGESEFRHLKGEDMSSWLEDYSLGDLWEKNIIGGRP